MRFTPSLVVGLMLVESFTLTRLVTVLSELSLVIDTEESRGNLSDDHEALSPAEMHLAAVCSSM